MATEFVTVYLKDGPNKGAKQRVPKHWLGVPSIAKQFTKTPRQRKADERASASKPDPVATTTDKPTVGDVNPETPATGDEKE